MDLFDQGTLSKFPSQSILSSTVADQQNTQLFIHLQVGQGAAKLESRYLLSSRHKKYNVSKMIWQNYQCTH